MRMWGVFELFMEESRLPEARLASIDCLRFLLLSSGFRRLRSLERIDGNLPE